MIGWAQLREAARAAPSRPDLNRVAANLSRRRLQLGDVGRRASWPSAPNVLAGLMAAQQRLDEADFAHLADVMQQPHRSYVLRAGEGEERYALLGSWEGPRVGWTEVTMSGVVQGGEDLRVRFTDLPPDAPGLADELNALYSLSVDPKHRPRTDPCRRTLDRALWVGGSAGETGDEEWEHKICGLFASRGLDVEIFARPGDASLDRALRVVEGFRGAMTVVWRSSAGDAERRARLVDAAKRTPVILDEHDFSMALVEAALALDQRDQDRAQEIAGIGAPAAEPGEPLVGGPHHFKKTGTGGGGYGDRMELVSGPCIHDNFRRARRPDQAKRGIARVAKAEPVKLQHCESCTGGGFWRAWF